MNSRAMIALVWLAGAAPPAALAQTASQPPEQGLASATLLRNEMNAYAQANFGDPNWPRAMSEPEGDPARSVVLRGQLFGPGGFQRPMSVGVNVRGNTSTTSSYPEGLVGGWRGRETPAGVELLGGVMAGGRAHIVSRTGVSLAEPTRIELGGGYAVEFTPEVRQRTPEEMARTQAQAAQLLADAQARGLAPPTPGAAPAPAPPVVFSPLTNSVIRAGDPRAGGGR